MDGRCLSDKKLLESRDSVFQSPHNLLFPGLRIIAEFGHHEQYSNGRYIFSSGMSENNFVTVSAHRRHCFSNDCMHTLERSETCQRALTNGFV